MASTLLKKLPPTRFRLVGKSLSEFAKWDIRNITTYGTNISARIWVRDKTFICFGKFLKKDGAATQKEAEEETDLLVTSFEEILLEKSVLPRFYEFCQLGMDSKLQVYILVADMRGKNKMLVFSSPEEDKKNRPLTLIRCWQPPLNMTSFAIYQDKYIVFLKSGVKNNDKEDRAFVCSMKGRVIREWTLGPTAMVSFEMAIVQDEIFFLSWNASELISYSLTGEMLRSWKPDNWTHSAWFTFHKIFILEDYILIVSAPGLVQVYTKQGQLLFEKEPLAELAGHNIRKNSLVCDDRFFAVGNGMVWGYEFA